MPLAENQDLTLSREWVENQRRVAMRMEPGCTTCERWQDCLRRGRPGWRASRGRRLQRGREPGTCQGAGKSSDWQRFTEYPFSACCGLKSLKRIDRLAIAANVPLDG